MTILKTYNDIHAWHLNNPEQGAEDALENGKVLFLPNLNFELRDNEIHILTPSVVAINRKNVSYNPLTDKLSGATEEQNTRALLQSAMKRFAESAQSLVGSLLPHYSSAIKIGRTSFRPVEIEGRKAPSYRKDDTRLHIDAFPSTPMREQRILRVFCNVNPEGKPRRWRTGEAFADVAARFARKLPKPLPGVRQLKRLAGLTKKSQSLYDHYMLALHNNMKKDMAYQKAVKQENHELPAGATWACFTDSVSHAAHGGQYVLEQTFYLPYTAMKDPAKAPQHILQQYYKKKLL